MKVQSSEKGQALIFIILAIVAVFGFAALAVDGGRIYSERRRAQAAVDSAALGAAYAAAEGLSHSQVKAKAIALAGHNGYAVIPSEKNLPDPQKSVLVEYFNPPQSGPYQGNVLYHQVRITERVDPIFAQILYGGESKIVVEAVTFSTVNCNCFANGNAIHASNPTAKSALEFDGNVNVVVKNGNIFSNSTSSTSGVKNGGSGKVTVQNGGKIWVVGSWFKKEDQNDPKKPPTVVPAPIENAPPAPLPNVPMPDCDSPADGTMNSTTNTLNPGRFDGKVQITNGDWTMKPGMYCFMNGFSFNGGTLTGNGVFIAMMGGDLKMTGNGKANLTRPTNLKDGKGNQWAGMLIYAPASNQEPIKLSGGNSTVFSGTVLAPGSECSFGGNSGAVGYNSNIICDTIKTHGGATININYIPENNYQLPPMVELTQ